MALVSKRSYARCVSTYHNFAKWYHVVYEARLVDLDTMGSIGFFLVAPYIRSSVTQALLVFTRQKEDVVSYDVSMIVPGICTVINCSGATGSEA
jgi:hypothetical protein